jgi:uncharacterized protein (DUF983 family)
MAGRVYVTICRRDMSADSPPHPCPECGHGATLHEPFSHSGVCIQCQIDMLNARLDNAINKKRF